MKLFQRLWTDLLLLLLLLEGCLSGVHVAKPAKLEPLAIQMQPFQTYLNDTELSEFHDRVEFLLEDFFMNYTWPSSKTDTDSNTNIKVVEVLVGTVMNQTLFLDDDILTIEMDGFVMFDTFSDVPDSETLKWLVLEALDTDILTNELKQVFPTLVEASLVAFTNNTTTTPVVKESSGYSFIMYIIVVGVLVTIFSIALLREVTKRAMGNYEKNKKETNNCTSNGNNDINNTKMKRKKSNNIEIGSTETDGTDYSYDSPIEFMDESKAYKVKQTINKGKYEHRRRSFSADYKKSSSSNIRSFAMRKNKSNRDRERDDIDFMDDDIEHALHSMMDRDSTTNDIEEHGRTRVRKVSADGAALYYNNKNGNHHPQRKLSNSRTSKKNPKVKTTAHNAKRTINVFSSKVTTTTSSPTGSNNNKDNKKTRRLFFPQGIIAKKQKTKQEPSPAALSHLKNNNKKKPKVTKHFLQTKKNKSSSKGGVSPPLPQNHNKSNKLNETMIDIDLGEDPILSCESFSDLFGHSKDNHNKKQDMYGKRDGNGNGRTEYHSSNVVEDSTLGESTFYTFENLRKNFGVMSKFANEADYYEEERVAEPREHTTSSYDRNQREGHDDVDDYNVHGYDRHASKHAEYRNNIALQTVETSTISSVDQPRRTNKNMSSLDSKSSASWYTDDKTDTLNTDNRSTWTGQLRAVLGFD